MGNGRLAGRLPLHPRRGPASYKNDDFPPSEAAYFTREGLACFRGLSATKYFRTD